MLTNNSFEFFTFKNIKQNEPLEYHIEYLEKYKNKTNELNNTSDRSGFIKQMGENFTVFHYLLNPVLDLDDESYYKLFKRHIHYNDNKSIGDLKFDNLCKAFESHYSLIDLVTFYKENNLFLSHCSTNDYDSICANKFKKYFSKDNKLIILLKFDKYKDLNDWYTFFVDFLENFFKRNFSYRLLCLTDLKVYKTHYNNSVKINAHKVLKDSNNFFAEFPSSSDYTWVFFCEDVHHKVILNEYNIDLSKIKSITSPNDFYNFAIKIVGKTETERELISKQKYLMLNDLTIKEYNEKHYIHYVTSLEEKVKNLKVRSNKLENHIINVDNFMKSLCTGYKDLNSNLDEDLKSKLYNPNAELETKYDTLKIINNYLETEITALKLNQIESESKNNTLRNINDNLKTEIISLELENVDIRHTNIRVITRQSELIKQKQVLKNKFKDSFLKNKKYEKTAQELITNCVHAENNLNDANKKIEEKDTLIKKKNGEYISLDNEKNRIYKELGKYKTKINEIEKIIRAEVSSFNSILDIIEQPIEENTPLIGNN